MRQSYQPSRPSLYIQGLLTGGCCSFCPLIMSNEGVRCLCYCADLHLSEKTMLAFIFVLFSMILRSLQLSCSSYFYLRIMLCVQEKKRMHLSFLLFPLSVVCITAEAVKLTALKKILRIRLVQAGQGSQAQLKARSNSNCSADSLMRSYW